MVQDNTLLELDRILIFDVASDEGRGYRQGRPEGFGAGFAPQRLTLDLRQSNVHCPRRDPLDREVLRRDPLFGPPEDTQSQYWAKVIQGNVSFID